MQVPTVKQLLLEPPVDWIRLKNTDEVIVTEPIYPRPDTLKKLEKKIEEMNKNRPAGQAELEAWRNERMKLNYVNVVLPGGGDAPEFRLETKKIEEIIYHEELLLRRVDLLVEAGEQRQAFELLYQLERRLPDWPGLDDRKNHLLFMEAEGFRKKKDSRVRAGLLRATPRPKTRLSRTEKPLERSRGHLDFRRRRVPRITGGPGIFWAGSGSGKKRTRSSRSGKPTWSNGPPRS